MVRETACGIVVARAFNRIVGPMGSLPGGRPRPGDLRAGHLMARDEHIANKATSRRHLLSPRFAPENIRSRREQVFDHPAGPLNEWVSALRADPRLPSGAGSTIPFFDPRGGGVAARVMFLMQDPSEVATFTGFISPDNNDPSAHNSTVACAAAGLDARDRVHWNIFPWWVNITKSGQTVDPPRPPQSYPAAMPLAARLLGDVLALLPRLQVVVLLGKQAQAGWKQVAPALGADARRFQVLNCPSCSPQAWNNIDRSDPAGRYGHEVIIATLADAARIIETTDPCRRDDEEWTPSRI